MDDTESARLKEQRDYSQNLLENLARLVPGVIYQYRLHPDGHSEFPWSSPGMNLIYEVTPEEVRTDATIVFGRLHPEDRDRVSAAILESARTLETFYCEFRVILPRQGLRWRWSQAQPERIADGGTLWHGIIIDITERKLTEQQNLKLQEQLLQAMKMEAVGRLAGGVAHDFNNLLTAIAGNAALALREPDLTTLARDALFDIGRAADSAAALTRQLLAFSRKQLIEPKVLDPNALILKLRRMLVRLLGEDIELTTHFAQPLDAIEMDEGQFEQILMNLAVNARDAMPLGGKLTIETANVELDAEYRTHHAELSDSTRFVMVAVSDTGHGIDETVKAHLFEPFFTTKDKGKGTGLGLATIYGVVKQAGGSVDVSTEVGCGTTFKIYLPSVVGHAAAEEVESANTETPGGHETILLVEDEVIVRRLAIRVLSRLGYEVLHAKDGASAISLVERHAGPIHLLLTDVVMPGMSGPEMVEKIVKLRPEILVLYTSGYSENAISRHGVLNAGISFLPKPYVPHILATRIRQVLEGTLPRLTASPRWIED